MLPFFSLSAEDILSVRGLQGSRRTRANFKFRHISFDAREGENDGVDVHDEHRISYVTFARLCVRERSESM